MCARPLLSLEARPFRPSERPEHRGSEGFVIARWNERRDVAARDKFRNSTNRRCNKVAATCHCFERNNTECFYPAW